MKCSVCAREIPEDGYSDHLAAEHGVTDDPSAVLFEHLTGDRFDETSEPEAQPDEPDEEVELRSHEDEDEDEDELESDADEPTEVAGDVALDDEHDAKAPEIEDPFERMLAEHPTTDARELAAWRAAQKAHEDAAPGAPEASDDDGIDEHEPEPAGAQDDEKDEEEVDPLDALVAAYPSWDVRSGAADVGTVLLPEREEPKRGLFRRRAAAPQPADAAPEPEAPEPEVAEPAVAAPEAGESEAEPEFELRPAAPSPASEDDVTVPMPAAVATASAEPPPGVDHADEVEEVAVAPGRGAQWERQRRLAGAGLVAVVILLGAAVAYLLTHDSDTTKTAATSRTTLGTVATTVEPTFLPGAQGGDTTTTIAATNTTAATSAVTGAPATTATTAKSTVDPRSRIAFSFSHAECTPQGNLSVFGSVTNNNPTAYSFSYVVTVIRPDGSSQGQAAGAVAHLPPGGRFNNNGGPIATGTSCTYPLVPGPSPRGQVSGIAEG